MIFIQVCLKMMFFEPEQEFQSGNGRESIGIGGTEFIGKRRRSKSKRKKVGRLKHGTNRWVFSVVFPRGTKIYGETVNDGK